MLGGSVKIYFWLPQSFNPPIAYLSVDQSYRDTFSCTLYEKHVLKPKKIHREMKPVKWSAHGHGSGSRANTTTAVAVSVRDHMRQLCEGKNWTLASNDEGANDESY